jgi:hypothetical protein
LGFEPRYIGTASAVACTEEDTVYKLVGCEKKYYCLAPPALGHPTERVLKYQAFCCEAPASFCVWEHCRTWPGYTVNEKSLVMQTFNVLAQCADGFHGAAKACALLGIVSIACLSFSIPQRSSARN